MPLDMAKYRAVFVEEATEHLAEISRALLELEKDPSSSDAIDLIFRMAHSIKGMAGSLEYPTVTELAHRLEDRMQAIRGAGRLPGGDELSLLFRGLSGLEKMVAIVRDTAQAPPAQPELVLALSAPLPAAASEAASKKKAPSPLR
ncbi:MAG TPA: Hpt domain-containing protein [Myxococcota bacterium]